MAKLSGTVYGPDEELVNEAKVIASINGHEKYDDTTKDNGGYSIVLAAGTYALTVEKKGYLRWREVGIELKEGQEIDDKDIFLHRNHVDVFRELLDQPTFNIETPISTEEANQAVSLFSVVNLMLAGLSRYMVANEEKTDILGVLNLYYGLQDKSLTAKLAVQDLALLWESVEEELSGLAFGLDQLQSNLDFLKQEARRQFNLGTNTSTIGNVQFPALFKRYIEIGTNPLLSINIWEAEGNNFFDREKLEKAYDLLRDLKGLLLQIVRSLSKYGTAATRRANQDWSSFEVHALKVLAKVAKARASDDVDEKNPWAVLAVLTDKNRDTEVAPYVVLGRHGGKLLEYAMQIYDKIEKESNLENFDRLHLKDLFQEDGEKAIGGGDKARKDETEKKFWTSLIRKEANVIKRYPLQNWG